MKQVCSPKYLAPYGVFCPTCWAQPGTLCADVYGRAITVAHDRRREVYASSIATAKRRAANR